MDIAGIPGIRADVMCCVDLNPIAPSRFHVGESGFGRFEHFRIVYVTKADTDTGSVVDGVGSSFYNGGRESAGGGLHNEMEGVFCVDVEAG